MKGHTVVLNGDPWTVVDLAPAAALAEMVAALLEEEGFVVQVRGAEAFADVLTHLGTGAAGATVVLVPPEQADAALALVAETVTDYEGAELEEVLALLADDPSALGADDALDDGDEADGDEADGDGAHDDGRDEDTARG